MVQEKDGIPVTTSLDIAEKFGKEHKHVLRDIEALECSKEFRESNFGLSEYRGKGNGLGMSRKYKMYYLTRQGFTMVVMGFNGAKAVQFKEKYINAFDRMEEALRNRQAPKELSSSALPISRLELAEMIVAAEKERLALAEENAKIVPFAYEGHAVRIVDQNGDPWFVAKDVCEVMGIKWTGHTLGAIPDRWKGSVKFTTPGGVQALIIINPPGTLQTGLPVEQA